MRVGGGRAPGARHEDYPAGSAVQGRLDPVAGDRAPAVAHRGRPTEQQPVGSARPAGSHPQPGRRARNGGVGGRACDVRPRAHARLVDRGDPVMARAAVTQADVGVRGGAGTGVRLERHPRARAGARHLDPVAGDRAAARGGGRGPAQIDGGRPPRPRREPARGARKDLVGPGACDVRGLARPVGVDRADPVVTHRARRETRVRVRGRGAPGVRLEIRPGRAAVRRHLDPVSADVRAAVGGRRVPLERDRRRAGGGRRQVLGCPGDLDARAGQVPDRPVVEARHSVSGQIPGRAPARVVVVEPDHVLGQDWLDQRQAHLRPGHLDLGHLADVERAVPEEGHGEVGRLRDEVLVKAFGGEQHELIAVDRRVQDIGRLVVDDERECPPDVGLAARVPRHAGRDVDDHRTHVARQRVHRDRIAAASGGPVQNISHSCPGGDLDLVDAEVGHALREADVETELLLHVPGPSARHRCDPRGNDCS